MLERARIRVGTLLVATGVISGLAYAAVRPVAASARQPTARVAGSPALKVPKIQQAFIQALKTKAIQQQLNKSIISSLAAQQNQAKIEAELKKQIESKVLQQTLTKVVANQGFVQTGAQLESQVLSQLKSAASTSALTQTLSLSSYLKSTAAAADSTKLGGLPSSQYVQGQAKVITGQASSTSGGLVTVLTIPSLLHVTALWWPSDGTAQFNIVNDSGGTLDYGGDFTGIPYEDNFSVLNQQFGDVGGPSLSAADGTIGAGGTESFQITPQPAQGCDTPSQEVPYRGEAHVQVTAPGSALASLDLSTYVINPACASGSALLSGMAVVAPT